MRPPGRRGRAGVGRVWPRGRTLARGRPFHHRAESLSMGITVRPATAGDIAFVMATERGPGFEHLVGRSEEAQHRQEMGGPGIAYLIGERDGAPNGFAIL